MEAGKMGSVTNGSKNVMETPAFRVFDFLLDLPFMHELLFGIYKMQSRLTAEKIDVAWKNSIQTMRDNLPKLREYQISITNNSFQIPEYYYVTTHAYKQGNLCWDSAMEEDLWSMLIMAPLYKGNKEGHMLMREEWLKICSKYIDRPIESATDLGCGTGLTTFLVGKIFPSVQKIYGIDLSPYKLAICMHKLAEIRSSQSAKYSFHHCSAEDVSSVIESDTQDLVSLCSFIHEIPNPVAETIFVEAYRILRPGGILTILDVDRNNMESVLTTPLLAAMFKRTEPYIADYLRMDYSESLSKVGFEVYEMTNLCASHKAIVAQKPYACRSY
jgi:ubiquinone/menaquinone biosynthesis C-methylase UbiE